MQLFKTNLHLLILSLPSPPHIFRKQIGTSNKIPQLRDPNVTNAI